MQRQPSVTATSAQQQCSGPTAVPVVWHGYSHASAACHSGWQRSNVCSMSHGRSALLPAWLILQFLITEQQAILLTAPTPHPFAHLSLQDADVVGADFLGQAVIPVSEVIDGKVLDTWLELTDTAGNVRYHQELDGDKKPSRVHITIQFVPVGAEEYKGLQYGEVPRTYFPLRRGNRITLYHDAVATPGPVPDIPLADGSCYNESSCWDDMYDSISQAKTFIWITGWSVWTNTMLKRTPAAPQNSPTFGELLVKKAEQGVRVLMLVWDDTTNNMGLHAGVMATHDQDTYAYFKGTEVTCVLCPRQGGEEDSILQKFSRGNMFTHHQKTVILDAPFPAGADIPVVDGKSPTKRVVAYVGGLDLTNGRYDYHHHPLFETCCEGGPHCEDKYQGCIEGFDPSKPGPRQPWHDIHAKVEGPVAMDVAINFMERWSKQAGKLNLHKLTSLDDEAQDILLPEALRLFTSKRQQLKGRVKGHMSLRMETIKAQDANLAVTGLPSAELWNTQLFRTIDSDSAEGFPNSSQGSYEAGLVIGKGKSVDVSIHRAYLHLIRHAKRYLYLENQYFLGSAHLWDSDTDTPCTNQVPAEIALKICSKIRAGEPFRVYIVLPMYPEGVPTSGSVQAILYYQAKTRQMMYKRIAAAIAAAGLTGEVHPCDYLQFFCLGKRETPPQAQVSGSEVQPTAGNVTSANISDGYKPISNGGDVSAALAAADRGGNATNANGNGNGTAQSRATDSRRFMIYVHSKMMIVDDEYILVGSANINQRSLDGSRDSEIAIGAFQNGYTLAGNPHGPLPNGQVAGFRKALFKEHCHELRAELDDPSDVHCIRMLSKVGAENWAAYASPEVQPLPYGHLMTYPTWVDSEGNVLPLDGCEEVPDLKGNLCGTKSMVLPPILTT
eukprot:GHUV01011310.1.p1 GENE.GHUV01011310.1~~GHUV01011310.1.p1  ORF type:complete len:894 (+),score=260.77 GHUV01011310.1:345-3026(+)